MGKNQLDSWQKLLRLFPCREGRVSRSFCSWEAEMNPWSRAIYMSHANQEMSILTTKKNQNKVNTSSLSHRNFQRRINKTENKGR
jgi:hypothetical protein